MKYYQSTPYKSQANRFVERFNKILCDSLVKLLKESTEQDLLIELTLFIYYIAVNRLTQLSLYIIVYRIMLQFSKDQLFKQSM